MEKAEIISFPYGTQVPKDNFYTVGNSTDEFSGEHINDIQHLSKTALRKKYRRTYKCWDNMKQRRKKGAVIHKDFDAFENFLRHVGPCENKKYTLDRLDNTDPEYAPGKVEWRDKYSQNSNKGNIITLTHDDGRCHTVAQWSALTGQKAPTLYKRKKKGWADMEVITGNRAQTSSSAISNPFPYEKREDWENLYIQKVGNGYKGSKMAFLHEVSRELGEKLSIEALELEMRISNCGPDDSDRSILEMKLKQLNGKYEKARKIYFETSQQLKYEEEKLAFLRKYSHNKEVLAKQKANLHKILPRPNYTINNKIGF